MTLRVKLSSLILTEQEETMTDISNLNQTSGFCDDFESYWLVLAVLAMLSAMQRFLLIHECAMHMKNSCTYQVIVLHGKGCPSLTVSYSTHKSRWDTVPPAV